MIFLNASFVMSHDLAIIYIAMVIIAILCLSFTEMTVHSAYTEDY